MKSISRGRATGALLVTGALAAATFAWAGSATAVPSPGNDAPLQLAENPISGDYVVVLQSSTGKAVSDKHKLKPDRVYTSAVTGFSATLNAPQLAALRKDPAVKYVEQDARINVSGKPVPPPSDPDAPRKDGVATAPTDGDGSFQITNAMPRPVWGLDRVDQRKLPLDSTYKHTATGAGVTAYVIDTGLYAATSQLTGRIRPGVSFVEGDPSTTDCQGHGTHVAGTIGGSTYGVAEKVNIVPVRVFNCAGEASTSGILGGMDWVGSHHSGPSVANMSLRGGRSQAMNDGVDKLTKTGVVVVVAAGNDSMNACDFSPASAPVALTVGATDRTDTRAEFSNFGSCLDLFAPGVGITSAWKDGPTSTKVLDGTSMAAPHVTGLVALYLQANPSASVAEVNATMKSAGAWGVVTNPGAGSPNRFARKWNSTLTAVHTSKYDPDGSSWTQAAGPIRAHLFATPGTDADLYVERWSGTAWTTVARSETATNQEHIILNATAGTYRLRVYAFAGIGTYDVWCNRPN